MAFTAVHQAFNLTLGYALFTEGLADFFEKHPFYQTERPEIEAFFRASYDLFFGAEKAAVAAFPVSRLVKLCRACIRIERENPNRLGVINAERGQIPPSPPFAKGGI
jgi:mxaA protein